MYEVEGIYTCPRLTSSLRLNLVFSLSYRECDINSCIDMSHCYTIYANNGFPLHMIIKISPFVRSSLGASSNLWLCGRWKSLVPTNTPDIDMSCPPILRIARSSQAQTWGLNFSDAENTTQKN